LELDIAKAQPCPEFGVPRLAAAGERQRAPILSVSTADVAGLSCRIAEADRRVDTWQGVLAFSPDGS
jgi:hypothetical protein